MNFVSSVEEEYFRKYDPLSFIDFPINQYRLIRRFSYDWPLWQEELRTMNNDPVDRAPTSASEFLRFFYELSTFYKGIDEFDPYFDLPVAGLTIARLHILYRNKSGLLGNEETNGCLPLSEMELLELCATAMKNAMKGGDDIYHSFHWMSLFIQRMKKYLPYSSVLFMVEYVLKHSDNYGRPNHHYGTLAVERGVKKLSRVARLMKKFPKHLHKFYDMHDKDTETQVCRSTEDRSQKNNYCFVFHSFYAPYAPFKYEILHRDPYVAVVHDFIPLQMTHNFISAAIDEGSNVNEVVSSYSPDDKRAINTVEAKIRLSESTVFDHDHPLNIWLDNRVERATLLLPHSQPMRFGVLDGEWNHILHYGLSGHYKAHHDYVEMDSHYAKHGNRLATVLVYLTDVHSGGHTAFPKLNVSFPPRAGSALVWFNLDPLNGTPLPRTLHVACPVNVGKKWVINRWIRSHLKTGHSRPIVI